MNDLRDERPQNIRFRESFNFSDTVTLRNPEDFNLFWNRLSDSDKRSLAQAYIDAFEGPPWLEIGEYDEQDLMTNYIPKSIGDRFPVVVTIQYRNVGDDRITLVGASFGSTFSLEGLIDTKYKANPAILERVAELTGLQANDVIFYDNENFMRQGFQKMGIGKDMNKRYFTEILESGAEKFIWRTINMPWGQLKMNQALELGYNVTAFVVPDDFQVQGKVTPRIVYFCSKAEAGQIPEFKDLTEQQ